MRIQQSVIQLSSIIFIALLLSSCNSQKKINKDFNYFQRGLDSMQQSTYVEPKLQPNDLITIQVIAGSIRQEDAALFNLQSSSGSSTTSAASSASLSQTTNSGYQIDLKGNIELPKVGKIVAAGLTRQELAEKIRMKLQDEVKDPLVVVKYVQFKINVLGEVKKPGAITFKTEKVNILDALAEAGDLTDAGKREDIVLMRQNGDKLENYIIDLRNTSFMNSPAFYLQQNDVIYVGANKIKLKTLGNDLTNRGDIQLIFSGITVLALVINVLRR